jgi:hypothetical protein
MMKTLKSRLIGLTVVLTVLFGAAVLLFSYFHMRSEIRNGVADEFHAVLSGQGSVVQGWLDEKRAQINSQVKIAQRPDAIDAQADHRHRAGTDPGRAGLAGGPD